MENQPKNTQGSMSENNAGTVGRVVEQEKGGVVISEHHTPNHEGYAENDEDHRVNLELPKDEEEPRDSINEK